MPDIEVTRLTDRTFRVTVGEGGSTTEHEVTADPADVARIGGGEEEPEDVVGASFRFLLDREPKESILSSFDLTVISRYFPEYPSEIGRYL